MGWLTQDQVSRIKNIIVEAGLPTELPASLNTDTILENMAVDKKARDGQIFLVLLKDIGNAVVTMDYDHALLRETIDHFQSGEEQN